MTASLDIVFAWVIAFIFQYFENVLPLSFLACRVSAEKSADNLMRVSLCKFRPFPPVAFEFLFVLDF